MYLEPCSVCLDVSPNTARVAPGDSIEITAFYRDAEARPLAHQPVTWQVDYGTFLNADTQTDDHGKAYATLQADNQKHVATVWVSGAQAYGGAYEEYADPEDPSICITNPLGGEVSGFVPVTVYAGGADGSGFEGLQRIQLYVDGQPRGSITTNDERPSGLDTTCLSNGEHVLTATATDLALNTMQSQDVHITVNNPVSEVDYSSELFFDDPAPGNIELTAQMADAGTWSVEIRDYRADTPVYSTSGSGPGPIEAEWDGKVNGEYAPGIYKIIVSVLPSGQGTGTTRQYVATISRANASMLICGKVRGEEQWSADASIQEMYSVADACEAANVSYTMLLDPLWIENGDDRQYPYAVDPNQGNRLRYSFNAWIKKGFHNFFYSTHGEMRKPTGEWQSAILFDSTDGQQFVYGDDYVWPSIAQPFICAFSDLNISPGQFNIVHINACYSGGNTQLVDPFHYYKLLPLYFEVEIPIAFGIPDEMEEEGLT